MIVKFREIADFIAGQSPESKYYSDNEGVPFLQGNRTFGVFYPTIDTYTTKVTKMAKKGDILMSVRAPVGDLNFSNQDVCIGRGLSAVRSKTGNNEFLFYALKYNIKNLLRQSSGTTFDSITRDVIEDMNMIIPDDATSYGKISKILYKIDLKIDNNIQIIHNLEEMAKTLYDYWFLQFEFPNEEGKPYKSSGGKMVWNEELKREIPENWENSTLSKVSNMYQPKTFDAKLLDDNGIFRVYGAGGYMGQYNKFNHAQSEVFISCRGSCGNVYKSMPFSLITGNAMIVQSADERLFNYLYLTLLRIGVKNCITGSVQPQITRDSLNDWKLVVPNAELIVKFNQIISPLLKKQEEIINENQELTSLRDFLLPMLMNGQVTFKS